MSALPQHDPGYPSTPETLGERLASGIRLVQDYLPRAGEFDTLPTGLAGEGIVRLRELSGVLGTLSVFDPMTILTSETYPKHLVVVRSLRIIAATEVATDRERHEMIDAWVDASSSGDVRNRTNPLRSLARADAARMPERVPYEFRDRARVLCAEHGLTRSFVRNLLQLT